MTPSPACYALIAAFEADVLHAYPDPGTGGRPWTIGRGHTGPDVYPGLTWSEGQSWAAFRKDVDETAQAVNAMCRRFTQNQFDALVSFAFNEGAGALRGSTLMRLHRLGLYGLAARQFARWNLAGKPLRVMDGLTNRRAREAALYRS